jgi:predicted RNA-binding Zn-ribbon protein involved in translation (DUF1610 family)
MHKHHAINETNAVKPAVKLKCPNSTKQVVKRSDRIRKTCHKDQTTLPRLVQN